MVMIDPSYRKKQIRARAAKHIIQNLKERGPPIFGRGVLTPEMIQECKDAILDPTISVIVPDRRQTESTHHVLFISKIGGYACLPCIFGEKEITWLTIKDIKTDTCSRWYIEQYNTIANERKMPLMYQH